MAARVRMATIAGSILVFAMAAIGGVPRLAAAEEPLLNVYNWSDYIAPDMIPKFEAETGIKGWCIILNVTDHPTFSIPVRIASRRSIRATTSSIDQRRSETPAAIAGVIRSVLCMRTKL
jgi:hypothetical protein